MDWEADVLYVVFDEKADAVEAEEVGEELILNRGGGERVVGLEVRGLSAKCGPARNRFKVELREPPSSGTD